MERTAVTVCGACGSETATSNMMAVNKRVKLLEDSLSMTLNADYEERKAIIDKMMTF